MFTNTFLPSYDPGQKVACDVCNLSRLCLNPDMPADELSQLSKVVRRNRTLQRGQYVYHAGDRFTGIFALKSGSAKLVYTDKLGCDTVVSVLLPGELQGFDGMANGQYQCSLITLETSSYCELPAHELSQVTHESPSLQRLFQQKTCEMLNGFIERIASAQRPAEERLVNFLLDLAKRHNDRGFSAEQYHLSLTRQEIGNHLGLALETVSRLLGKLECAEMIRVQGKHIQLLDVKSLVKLSGKPSS